MPPPNRAMVSSILLSLRTVASTVDESPRSSPKPDQSTRRSFSVSSGKIRLSSTAERPDSGLSASPAGDEMATPASELCEAGGVHDETPIVVHHVSRLLRGRTAGVEGEIAFNAGIVGFENDAKDAQRFHDLDAQRPDVHVGAHRPCGNR